VRCCHLNICIPLLQKRLEEKWLIFLGEMADFVLDDLDMDDEEKTNNGGGRGDEQDKDDVGLGDLDDGY
jgi:hypothetical protein